MLIAAIRESWKDYQGSYHPVFSHGWAPEYPFTEERERAEVTAAAAASEAQRVYRDKIRRAQEEVRRLEFNTDLRARLKKIMVLSKKGYQLDISWSNTFQKRYML